MIHVPLKCECGRVSGVAEDISPTMGNHGVCYCSDCQAFARLLERESAVLDQYGGTDLFQMPVGHLRFTEGQEEIRCLRLTPKGLYRWYAGCCNTPIGNTVGPGIPWVGVVHNVMQGSADLRRAALGPVRFHVQGKDAMGTPPGVKVHPRFPFMVLPRLLWLGLKAKLRGRTRPNPFFENGQPLSRPRVVETSVSQEKA